MLTKAIEITSSISANPHRIDTTSSLNPQQTYEVLTARIQQATNAILTELQVLAQLVTYLLTYSIT